MKTLSLITGTVLASILLGPAAIAQNQSPALTSAPNQVAYVPQLPTAADLMKGAAASNGVTVQQISQTSDHITVTYNYAGGQTSTVTYELLLAAPSNAAAVPVPATVAPAVVYQTAPAYYYSYPYPYYYGPYGWYAPVSVRFGFGFRRRWR